MHNKASFFFSSPQSGAATFFFFFLHRCKSRSRAPEAGEAEGSAPPRTIPLAARWPIMLPVKPSICQNYEEGQKICFACRDLCFRAALLMSPRGFKVMSCAIAQTSLCADGRRRGKKSPKNSIKTSGAVREWLSALSKSLRQPRWVPLTHQSASAFAALLHLMGFLPALHAALSARCESGCVIHSLFFCFLEEFWQFALAKGGDTLRPTRFHRGR